MCSVQGRIQGFPKGGVETRDTKCGGEGGAARFRPDTKSGGGGLSALDPTRKAGWGGGCCPFQARYKKRGGGGGGGVLSI